MEIVKEKEAETTEECELARKKARKIRLLFEKVKTDRYHRFHECFEPVSQKIDDIYKVNLLIYNLSSFNFFPSSKLFCMFLLLFLVLFPSFIAF